MKTCLPSGCLSDSILKNDLWTKMRLPNDGSLILTLTDSWALISQPAQYLF